MKEDLLWLNIRELPYFRGFLRAVEGRLIRELEFPEPVLDLGCGDGHFVSVTFNRKLDVGIDPFRKSIREAKGRGAYRYLLQADGAEIPFGSNFFSSAISNSVLEHIPHLAGVLCELARVLKPDAPLVFTVPNRGYLEMLSISSILHTARLRALAEAYQNWFMWMSRTINLFDEEGWAIRLEEAGFRIEKTFRYFSPSALRVLEWGHYFGAPCLLVRWLTGRWILSPTRFNLWLTERFLQRYYDEPPSVEGTYSFFLARRR